MKVLILLSRIDRGSGGRSTVIDLAETVYALGFDVYLGLSTNHLMYGLVQSYKVIRGENRNHTYTTIPFKRIYSIPANFTRIGEKFSEKTGNKERRSKIISYLNIKKGVNNLLNQLPKKTKKFNEILKEVDLIINGASFTGDAITQFRNLSSAPIIYNHSGSPEAFEDYWLTDEYIPGSSTSNRDRYKKFCNHYDGLLFQAFEQKEECISRNPELNARCFVISPSCQESEVLAAKQLKNPYEHNRRSIVCVGSIQPRKAQHQAIKAFNKIYENCTDVDLHFIGGGMESEYGHSLKELVNDFHLQRRVYFHGHRTDYLRYMAHAELILQSSEAEGVSRILREAMLMKAPIVSFAISGTSSILEKNQDALLIEPENTTEMAIAIKELLDNKEKASALAESAYKKYLINHSWPAYATNIRKMVKYYMN